MDIGTQHGLERPLAPLPVAQPALGFGDAARGGHQQRKAEIGGGFGEHVRRVAGQDAGRTQGVDVEIVVAHADVGDGAQLRRRSDFRRTDPLVERDQRAVQRCQPRGQLGRRPDGDVLGGGQLEMLAQLRDQVVEQRLADPHLGASRVRHRPDRECAARSHPHRRTAHGGAMPGPSAPTPSSPRRSGWRGCPRTGRAGRW